MSRRKFRNNQIYINTKSIIIYLYSSIICKNIFKINRIETSPGLKYLSKVLYVAGKLTLAKNIGSRDKPTYTNIWSRILIIGWTQHIY